MSPALTDRVFTNSATWEEEICSTKPSLVAQVVKNLPAVQETQIRSLDQEDLWGKGMGTHSSILAWESPWADDLAGYSPWSCKESDMTMWLTISLFKPKTNLWIHVICSKLYRFYFMCVYICLSETEFNMRVHITKILLWILFLISELLVIIYLWRLTCLC